MKGEILSKRGERKRGAALLIILLFLFALLMMGTAFLTMLDSARRANIFQTRSSRAFFLAEAGLDRAIRNIRKDASWVTGFPNTPLGEGSYSVTVTEHDDATVTITSTGRVFGEKRTIAVGLRTCADAFYYALFYGNTEDLPGSYTVKGSTRIAGDTFFNGDIDIQNPAQLTDGEVYSTGTASGTGTYETGTLDPFHIPTFPSIDSTYYDTLLTTAAGESAGDETFTNYDLNGATIYVNGNVILQQSIDGPGTIVATGDIYIHGHATIGNGVNLISGKKLDISGSVSGGSLLYAVDLVEIDGNLGSSASVISKTEVAFNGNIDVNGLVYAPLIDMRGHAVDIVGSVVGNYFRDAQFLNPSVTWDVTVLDQAAPPGLGGGRIIPGSWKEIYN